MPWSEDFAAWQAESQRVRAIAERTRRAMVERARRIAVDAGLGPDAPFHYAHNASVSRHYGRPWRGVDYSAVRRLQRLERLSWEPSRLADRINGRTFDALRARHL